jgi:2-aminoadipate transaminase
MKIELDRGKDLPLYAQLRDGLSKAIQEGALSDGHRLPSVVAYAKQLGVTQATVLRAFEDLAAAGYLESRVGRGTYVKISAENPDKNTAASAAAPFLRSPIEPVDPDFAMAARRLRMGVSKSLEALQVLKARPGLIDFTSGIPDPSIIKPGLLAELTEQALKAGQDPYLGYGLPAGFPELREAVASRLDPSGSNISADQVLITSGSQQAVSLLAQAALEQNQRVVCEMPGYPGIANAFGAIGHWVESVPRDPLGPLTDRLNRFTDGRSVLFYLCPEIHNPMGTDMAPERRFALMDWVKSRNAMLVADEIFHDLRFEPPAPPSLLQEGGGERVVAIGSLSKSFMCGLRVGWLVSGAERVRSLTSLKRAMDISCPPLMQGVAIVLLKSGAYEEHIARAREHYHARCEAALNALRKHMPEGVTWTSPKGGFHLWVELPSGYSSIALYLLGIERGVAISPGPQLDVDHRFIPAFRLSYGSLAPETIEEGIEQLSAAASALLQEPPSDPGLSGLGNLL